MSWIHLPSVTLTQGSANVAIHNALETTHVQIGDALLIADFPVQEIAGIFADQLVLKSPWTHATQTKVASAIIPTAADFQSAAEMLRAATTVTQGNFAEMEKWWTLFGTVTFTDYSGQKHTVKTAKEMEKQVQAQIDTIEQVRASAHFMGTAQHTGWLQENRAVQVAAGFNTWGKHHKDSVTSPINQGMYVVATEPNSIMLGHAMSGGLGISETNFPSFHMAGVTGEIEGIGKYPHITNIIEFPEAEKGTRTINNKTGVSRDHLDEQPSLAGAVNAAFAEAAASADIEVVITRYDGLLLEQTDVVTNEVFFRGCVQSQATSFGDTGIATELSSRPASYFAMYPGQPNVKVGRCVKLDKLTPTQRAAVARIQGGMTWVNEEGNYTSTERRFRTQKGLGNGDWYSKDCSIPNKNLSTTDKVQSLFMPQGHNNEPLTPSFTHCFVSTRTGTNPIQERGAFTAKGTVPAYKGRCFVYYLGSYSRLNQGFKHLFNDFGTKKAADNKFWYETTQTFATLKDCFDPAKLLTASGRIGTPSGRYDDGKLFDRVDASGQGGFNDDRMPAFDMGAIEQKAKVLAKVESGTCRGEEQLNFTTPFDGTRNTFTGVGQTLRITGLGSASTAGEPLYLIVAGSLVKATIQSVTDADTIVSSVSVDRDKLTAIIVNKLVNETISGGFLCHDWFGLPSDLLATDVTSQGWYGYWMPDIASAASRRALSRKAMNTNNVYVQWTTDNGVTWKSGVQGFSNVTNDTNAWSLSDSPAMFSHTAFAYQTEETNELSVLNSTLGVGDVCVTSEYIPGWGALLAESTLGIISKNKKWGSSVTLKLRSFFIDNRNGVLASHRDTTPIHEPLTLTAPLNDSDAAKILSSQCAINGKANIQFHANQLKYTANTGAIAVTPTNNVKMVVGKTYMLSGFDNTTINHRLYRVSKDLDTTPWTKTSFNGWHIDLGTGDIVTGSGNKYGSGVLTVILDINAKPWGDDSRIKIGNGTFKDKNGIICLMSNHTLTKPLGYTVKSDNITTVTAYVASYYNPIV